MTSFERQNKARARRREVSPKFAFHKRFHSDALAGMADLNPEERGIYNTIIDLMYQRRSVLPDDDAWLARVNNCPLRTYRRVKKSLLAKGRIITCEESGALYDERALRELNDAGFLREMLSAAGKRGAEKRWNKSEHETPKNSNYLIGFVDEKLQEVDDKTEKKQRQKPKKAMENCIASQNPEENYNVQSNTVRAKIPRAALPPRGGGAPLERPPDKYKSRALRRAQALNALRIERAR